MTKEDDKLSELQSASMSVRHRLNFKCIRSAGGASDRAVLIQLSDVTHASDGRPGSVGEVNPPKPIVNPSANKEGFAEYADQGGAVDGLGGLSGRRLSIWRLDIFRNPTAVPQVVATRNEILGGVEVADAFRFTTTTSTLDRLVPRLHCRGRLTLDSRATLVAHLSTIAQQLFADAEQVLTVDAVATLKVPFNDATDQAFSYPLGAMKGITQSNSNGWAGIFEAWASRIDAELRLKRDGRPSGISFSILVYAEGYAGGRPVLAIDDVWLPWNNIAPAATLATLQTDGIHDPEAVAAAVYNLTRGLLPLRGRSTTESVSHVRERVTRLVQSRAKPLNLLETNHLPDGDDLIVPSLREVWSECIGFASEPRAAGLDGDLALPVAWALAPVDSTVDSNVAFTAQVSAPILSDAYAEFSVTRQSDTLLLTQVSAQDVFAGEVALFEIYDNRASR